MTDLPDSWDDEPWPLDDPVPAPSFRPHNWSDTHDDPPQVADLADDAWQYAVDRRISMEQALVEMQRRKRFSLSLSPWNGLPDHVLSATVSQPTIDRTFIGHNFNQYVPLGGQQLRLELVVDDLDAVEDLMTPGARVTLDDVEWVTIRCDVHWSPSGALLVLQIERAQ